ncbi:MAG: SDR family oxidoreductase [Lysobacterales bacterium]
MQSQSQTATQAVLITGASAGIGASFAHAYAARGKALVLTARRSDRLRALAASLAPVHCEVIECDLSDRDAPRQLQEEIEQRGLSIDTLVNNAGYGVTGSFLSRDWSTHADFVQVMITSVCELTHRFLPGMREKRYGRVINVASLAGLVPSSAGHTLYGASKSFVIRFSESLALELRDSGVNVCALCPGFTWTEFHDANGMRPRMRNMPKWLWQSAEAVVDEGIEAVERGRSRHVSGAVNRALVSTFKHLPQPLADALIRRQSRAYRDTQ